MTESQAEQLLNLLSMGVDALRTIADVLDNRMSLSAMQKIPQALEDIRGQVAQLR